MDLVFTQFGLSRRLRLSLRLLPHIFSSQQKPAANASFVRIMANGRQMVWSQKTTKKQKRIRLRIIKISNPKTIGLTEETHVFWVTEPQGRGLYMDVFRLPTACSCHIRPSPGFSLLPGAGQRPGSMDRPERGSSQLFGEATQNIPVHTRVGVSQTAASQLIPQPSNRNPVMVPPSQSSLFDSYLPPGAHTAYQPPPPDFNMPQ